MGIKIKDLAKKGVKRTKIRNLRGKVICIDAFNKIFRFLSAIRNRDGTPLTDSKGRIVSHLSGLFYRNINLIANNIKPIFVFDGKPPQLKLNTIEKRKERKKKAKELLEKAKKNKDTQKILKYSKRTSELDDSMIQEAKELLLYFGVPVIQAPSEGEAQAAFMVKKGDSWAVSSNDYDTLLFGGERLLNNFKITKKSIKKNKSISYISLPKLLSKLEINQQEFIEMCILVGTDYYSGVKWVGQHTALKLIKKYGSVQNIVENKVEIRGKKIQIADELVRKIISQYTDPHITRDYGVLEWNAVQFDKLEEIMIENHNFSKKRITNALNRIRN